VSDDVTVQAPVPFVVGDVVRLKSGGPLMTVGGFAKDDDGNLVDVTWFSGDIVKDSSFPPEALVKVDPTATMQSPPA
jgi:uncharacterized protein YodC (DUF2158 family)